MSLIYIILGMFGFVIQVKVLEEVIGQKLFNKIDGWLQNGREVFFYITMTFWMAYIFTSQSVFYLSMLASLGFAGMVFVYSVIFEVARFLRKRNLKERRKKKQ